MDLIQLDIAAIKQSDSQNNAYVLLLNESKGRYQLPIVIGWCEARSIAIALEGSEKPERPLTHDLFKTFSNSFNITIERIVIHTLVEGIFHASFNCINKDTGEEISIDSRASDAIALAIRFSCPIFTYQKILNTAGINISNKKEGEEKKSNKEKKKRRKKEIQNFTIEELDEALKKAINNEDYEAASKIRDEINKRKNNK